MVMTLLDSLYCIDNMYTILSHNSIHKVRYRIICSFTQYAHIKQYIGITTNLKGMIVYIVAKCN